MLYNIIKSHSLRGLCLIVVIYGFSSICFWFLGSVARCLISPSPLTSSSRHLVPSWMSPQGHQRNWPKSFHVTIKYCTQKYFEINPYFLILSSILTWFHLSFAFFPLRALHYMLSIKSCRDSKSNFQAKHDYFSTVVSLKPSLFSRLVGFLLSVHHPPASSGSLQCFINVSTSELFIWVFSTQNCICVVPSKLWAPTPLAGHFTNCNLFFFLF